MPEKKCNSCGKPKLSTVGEKENQGKSNCHCHNSAPSKDAEIKVDHDKFPIKRYKPIKRLGKGSGGTVFLSRDRVLDNKVAVKILNVLEPEYLISFQEEAKSLNKLNHPQVIKIINFGILESNTPYMVLEYFNGQTLERLLQRYEKIKWETLKTIVAKTALALAHAHEIGLYHRDLKPSNILVSNYNKKNMEIKLIDFGLAKVMELTGKTIEVQGKTLTGSPSYMSPDVASGKDYTECSEIYSLGCIMFEALTGRVPFEGTTALETVSLHANAPAPQMKEVCDHAIPKQAEKLVSKCLKKEPQDRFQSMNELISVMEGDLLATGLNSAPVEEKKERSPYFFLFICSIFIGGIGFLIINSIFQGNAPPKASEEGSLMEGSGSPIDYRIITQSYGIKLRKWTVPFRTIGSIKDQDLALIAEDLKRRKSIDLDLSDCELTGSGFKHLNRLKIKSLNLDTLKFDEQYVKDLNIPTLRVLNLKETGITDRALSEIAKMKGLVTLNFMGCKNISDPAVYSIFNLPKLKNIDLADTNVSDKALNIHPSSKLTRIVLDKTNITDDSIKRLAVIKTLNNLLVSQCKGVTIDGVREFCKEKPRVRTLDIAYLKTNGQPLTFLEKCENLLLLNVMGVPIKDNDLKSISKIKSLRYLYILNGDITNKGLLYLTRSRLSNLTLHNCKNLTKEGLYSLTKALPQKCKVMTDLDVDSAFGAESEGFKYLYESSGD